MDTRAMAAITAAGLSKHGRLVGCDDVTSLIYSHVARNTSLTSGSQLSQQPQRAGHRLIGVYIV